MKRLLYSLIATLLVVGCSNEERGEYYPDISTRELHYISRSGSLVEFNDDAFDAPIISNTYDEYSGGVVRFASPLRSIGFLRSVNITSITIPESVKNIGTQVFYKASNLSTVHYNSSYRTDKFNT